MVAGYHLIWTAYGWWLPNDPRGSHSEEIRVERIADLGELHHGRKVVQPPGCEIRRFYGEAKEVLQHELLTFTDEEMRMIAGSFGAVIRSRQYACYACAVMPDHIHLVMRRHADKAEGMIEQFQTASRLFLIDVGLRRPEHPVWGGEGWKRFLNTREDIERVIRYVRENPLKARRPEQRWPFVRPYDGWLPTRGR